MAKFTLADALGALSGVGAVAAALPEFKALWDAGISALKPQDQETAKAGYADLIANNAEGFARLDAKLEKAKAL